MNRVYEGDDGWIEIMTLEDGKVIMTAHSNYEKYSKRLMLKIAKTFLTFSEVYTILPYNYLVEFYNKHTHVELVDDKTRLYKIYGRRY